MEEITMSELWQTPSGDTTTPLSDIKDLDDLNSFYEDYDEVMFDQSISLFNFHDNFLINDYFLSMDTGFSSLNQTDDSCDNLTSLSFKQEPVSDFSFLFEDHTQNYITNTNITSFLNVDPGLRSKQKNIYNKKMNNLNTDYGDMISSTFSKPDFITDINDENVMFSDCSPCDTSNSSECSSDCASSGSNSYISEREATDEDSKKDMVVLGVDLSSLMHDYAARSPARDTKCVLLKESQLLSSNTSIPQFSNIRSSEVKVQSSKYTPASFSVTKLENSDFYTAIRKNKTTPWKPNLIICRKTDNKLPQGAGHRMTSTGNDPMLSTYQIQDQPLSSSPPPISLKLDNLRAISNPSSSPSSTTTPSRTPGHDEKIHPCTYKDCQKVYNKSSHLKAHMRRHTGEKPFHCSWPDCEWKFSRSDELARHKRSHSGVKPYKCDFCLKCFSRSDHLSKHQKVHRKNN